MKKLNLIALSIFAAIVLAGCSVLSAFKPTATPQPAATVYVATEIPLPTPEPTLEPTATTQPTPAATPTTSPVTPLQAHTLMENLILRTGPGRLFDRVAVYPIDSQVQIIGREPSSNWVLVQTEDHRTGWMNVVGLSLAYTTSSEVVTVTEQDLQDVPVFNVPDAQVLRGHVYLQNGQPASGVLIQINPPSNDDMNKQDNNVTNSAGEWYIFVPEKTTGEWMIGPIGYNCTGTAVNDPINCALLGKFPDSQIITLPVEKNVMFEYSLQSY